MEPIVSVADAIDDVIISLKSAIALTEHSIENTMNDLTFNRLNELLYHLKMSLERAEEAKSSPRS